MIKTVENLDEARVQASQQLASYACRILLEPVAIQPVPEHTRIRQA